MQVPHTWKPTAAVRRHRPAFAVQGRLSSFFHGTSILGSRSTHHLRDCKTPYLRLESLNTSSFNNCQMKTPARVIKSPPTPPSTRPLFDPTSSLADTPSPLTPKPFERFSEGSGVAARAQVPSSRSVARMDLEEQRLTQLRRQHGLSRLRGRKGSWGCFSNVAETAIRRKIYSCLASSIILALILTTCSASL